MKGKILIADDDIRINELLQDVFTMEGYEVVSAENGQEALDVLEADPAIDLVLLDVMMPVLSGWDVLSYIRQRFRVKIVMLTALSNEASEVRGLREGADDYVAKPFRRAVLVERVRRLVGEKRDAEEKDLVLDDLCLSQSRCTVTVEGVTIRMTGKEYQLLLYFMRNSNLVLSREQILDAVWGIGHEGESRVVDSQIRMLRRSLGDWGQRIRTVRGLGYCLDGEVVSR